MKGGKRENAGRPKGSQNKDTKALRERITALMDERWDKLIQDIDKLSPKDRVNTMVSLLEYTLPKLNRTEVKDVTDIETIMALSPEERLERLEAIKRLKKVV